MVNLSNGRRTPICELAGEKPEIIALEQGRLTHLTANGVSRLAKTLVFKVTLASGRMIRAGAEHCFVGAAGSLPVANLMPGARLPIARTVRSVLANLADVTVWDEAPEFGSTTAFSTA